MIFFRKYIFSIFGFGLLSNIVASMFANLITVFVFAALLPTLMSAAIMFVFGYWIIFKNEIPKKRSVLSIIFAIAVLIFAFIL